MYRIIIAILYIFYGITKLVIGLSVMTLPLEIIKKTPILNLFAKESEDKTLAGTMYEYILILFGVYTIVHGFAMLHLFSQSFHDFIELKQTQYSIFIIIGLVLTIFYLLVLYTKLPISKDLEKYKDHYKLLGLGAGISFLIMPVLWEFIEYTYPAFMKLSKEEQSAFIIGSVILLAIIIELIYSYIKRKNIPITTRTIIPSDYKSAYDKLDTKIKTEL